jgi:hypothetical protein
MNARRLLVAAALGSALLVGCGPGSNEYDNNDLMLAGGHHARDMCSCLFVMTMPVSFCEAWAYAEPPVARYSVDFERKTVEASAFILWGARARYIGPHFGCQLE